MRLSGKVKLFILFIILNIILRFQTLPLEIGSDSFGVHILANSISEFGYAKWFLNPLSIFGLYPASYTSSVPFILSGISQLTNTEMILTIFLYCLFIGVLSIFTAYLMAGEIYDNNLFKLFTALGFSTVPAVLTYSTWTIPTRGLLIILAPLLIFLILKCRKSVKFIIPLVLISILLFSTHHLFYFFIPAFFSFFILAIFFKFKDKFKYFKISSVPTPLIIFIGFLLMFSYPFFTGKFIEHTRYDSIYVSYVRYMGPLIILAIGGLAYLIFRSGKLFQEYYILLTLMFLTIFIYQQTYMKEFLPIFLISFASIGLINLFKFSIGDKIKFLPIVFFLLLSIIFSGYYQFVHDYKQGYVNEREIEESTYFTGVWMKNYLNGSSGSNDIVHSIRILSFSETAHVLTFSAINNLVYDFSDVNISLFKRYPLTSEAFWYDGYKGPDLGEILFEDSNKMKILPEKLNLKYFVENVRGQGYIVWNHERVKSKLLQNAYDQSDIVYDVGKSRVWKI